MRKTLIMFMIIMICSLALALPVLAWEDCPLGMVDDPYPGACRRYVDTNGDGICDHSQVDPNSTTSSADPPEKVAQVDPFPSKDVSSPNTIVLPQEDVPNPSLSSTASVTEELSLSRTPSPASVIPGATQGNGRGNGGGRFTEEWVYFLGTIALLLLVKGMGLARDASRGRQLVWFTPANIRWLLNALLTVSFTLSFLSGLADFLSLSFGWFRHWGPVIVTLHLDASMVLLAVGIAHAGWHIPYYRNCVRRGRSLRQNPKIFGKWSLNLILTISFFVSLASGVLDLLALRFHWFPGASAMLLDLHLYSSLVMMGVGLIHVFWHLAYYRAHLCPRGSDQTKKNPLIEDQVC